MYENLLTFRKIKHIKFLMSRKTFFFLENPSFKKVNFQNIYVLQEMIDYFFIQTQKSYF